jgi:hypothetical protein
MAIATKNKHTSKSQFHLNTSSYDYNIEYIINLIEEQQITLEIPNKLWTKEKASKLIESILMNFPIPLLYLKEQQDGKWLIVDGIQRILAILKFYQNQYELTNLEILTEFESMRFQDLPPQAKRLINLSIMHIVLIRRNSNPNIIFNMVKRLNQ